MSLSAKKIWFSEHQIFVELSDGRIADMPLKSFPRLQNASAEQRLQFELWDNGNWIHWENLNEDLSAEGFLTFKPNSRE